MFGRQERPGPRVVAPDQVKRGNALTAAGQRITESDRRKPEPPRTRWQAEAFRFYDSLGEIKYAAQFYSRALSKLRLFAAEIDEEGEIIETTDAQAIEQLERIQDPGGGRSALLSTYGRLMFLAGEALLFVTKDKDTQLEQWEFLSTDEIRRQGDTYTRYRRPSVHEEYRAPNSDDFEPVADDDAVAYRIWRRHPHYSDLADSTMQGVLDVCEEIMLLTRAVRGRARSRLAGAGILFLPDSLTQVPLDAEADDSDPDEDPFLVSLTEHMTAPIADGDSASSVVPLVIRGPAEDIDKVSHLQIIDPAVLYPESGMRMELIKRLAIGLDLPPEILLGLQDSNHWSAWQIDEQTWKAHLQPVAQYLVDDLTAAYYRPQLRELGVANYEKFTIGYDAAEIINHPDRTTDAMNAHDRLVISDEAYREAAGFDDSDAPDEEELERRKPTPPQLDPEADPEDDAGESGTSKVKKDAPPDPVASSAAAAQMLGAADLAMRRGREKAGQRLYSLAKRNPEMRARLQGISPTLMAATLTMSGATILRAPGALELVAGASDLFVEALREGGLVDAETAISLGRQIERHAAATLFEAKPTPIPLSFASHILELQAA